MTIDDIKILAEEHGLQLSGEMTFNDMGIDFRVGFATDRLGLSWVLRIPRREGLEEQIEKERRILQLAQKHLSVEVPDWRIATSKLIAYPLLTDLPALRFDPETYEVTWHMDRQSADYIPSLSAVLVDLHRIPRKEALEKQLKILEPEQLRPEIAERLHTVKSELGISETLETRYKKWLDDDLLWPHFTCFVHGDLYAGHVLATPAGMVSGIIDWSTAHISDPSIDFSGHLTVFGEDSLKQLISVYEKNGGKVWEKLFEQTVERAAAAPLAYGIFAIETKDDKHIAGAKAQLGVA
ncbi:macrolide phosphotransferase [Sphingobacterium allocomposti]|uniref:Macrolide phosphotransferase n=1 Tax=Sphingobacterium allocomposti TaxID=415956 RepID=A0A5S5CW34_9SPHI|nr:Mph(E)/Mph(G) family macrolide 2'-phosphotransferase [Sphingobacterium composti Yoo et al. 2007 non Ten et al. 2007]TYP87815.1 macrolide phosphotransferase [Sphingobacterium composti Yoo et al. 2007 non Ten et al. 2007]